ncbi:MAG: hypothetical protein Q7S13_00680 [Candidatus Omnitrophota bacterium]|nr:hypothetical protein [Candidatus Omnitrophota bacterium]
MKLIGRKKRRGQSVIEYVILITILLGAFLAIGTYFKRGVQGRWKEAVDGFGDQYDPRAADTNIKHSILSNTNTTILAMNSVGGFWTSRTDESKTTEKKTGYMSSGAYE